MDRANGLVDNEIRALAVGGDGNVWLGSYRNGDSSYDGKVFSTWQTDDGMLTNRVRSVGVTSQDEIWIGHDGGVSHYDGQKWQVYDQIDSMELQVVYAVKIDPDNAVC